MAGLGELALVGAALGGDATLLVDANRELLVVGLERLADVAVARFMSPIPSGGAGPVSRLLRSDSSLR